MEVLENFVKKFFDGTAGGYAVSYSYMTLVVIAIACIVFLHIYVIKKDKSVIVGLSAMLGGWIIYLISLLILYQFSYTKIGSSLSCFVSKIQFNLYGCFGYGVGGIHSILLSKQE